ncbi:sodium:calcium antiporter [Enterococcus saccharolyticus]|uniref:Sodium/calcium exchanger membrane region domain-containing protein n=1 Tax=Enterococcus saccharolyticus subsp. saccharolyticus ATCC 43076 TaxID=1139996 RepID=S0NZD2_9ENTE|nr:sodium:calcium antiporter [Enterococcus saccharolyticus]EOT25595.1 hypothetical protein OMQ_02482 [Enterococcus saccharolyticus subsp. saccharolyticus ATCC 43076]EOT83295.1 hypothetical protein I572_00164 [Enterococcus saccharolyticus subsp. saccharolyticus ATCC 43076]
MRNILLQVPSVFLVVLLVGCLWMISSAADRMIDQALEISRKLKISEIATGATIVAFGTVVTELATAIMAINQHSPDIAVGNAMGSMVTNLSIIVGIGALTGVVPISRLVTLKTLFFSSLAALVFLFTFLSPTSQLPRLAGIFFLCLTPIYLWFTFKAKPANVTQTTPSHVNFLLSLFKLFLFIGLISLGAGIIVPIIDILAQRFSLSEGIISATVIAFVTNAPELSTMYHATRKGAGDLAVGNVIGANILNILVVLGIGSILADGLYFSAENFYLQFPSLLIIVLVFLAFIFNSNKHQISRKEGSLLIACYGMYILASLLLL